MLASLLSRSPLRLLAGSEPVAFAIHLQDVDMMGEPVEWQVAGDQRGAAFIALTEHLEEQLGADRRKRHIAQLVDDQQLDRTEVLLQSTQAALVTRFAAVVKATL